ncbi:BTB/POZ domain [Popillia japonica]|uniref:BTB/POZ domain n=1 Tax=Popillia japonica TaxID=7064 RepID=A0AAW1MCU0_POPJA
MITRIRKMNADFQTLITSRYPNEFKKKVILYAEKHNNSEAERVFGIAESNIRRWRKLKSLIFSKSFVSDGARKKRLVKKVAANNDDFIYEIEKLDNMLENAKYVKDLNRISPKTKVLTSPPALSPVLPIPTLNRENRSNGDSDADEVCLRWNSHHTNMKSTFPSLLQREQYVDVTLTSEGKSLKCHRLILSACSSYFDEILSGISPLQHPVIFLNGVSFWILKCLIDFMYAGEVHIEQNKLQSLLKVAEMLQIKGLTRGNAPQEESTKVMSPIPAVIPVKPEKSTPEPKGTPIKKDNSITSATATSSKSPVKKPISPTLISTIDPLSLLEPTFFEENPVPLRFKEQVGKKVVAKKIKKRKSSEHELSPPPLLYRKGTKSRPHVKIPRYYHNDFEGLEGKKSNRRLDETISSDVPELSNIKIESLIIETTNLNRRDNQLRQTTNLNQSAIDRRRGRDPLLMDKIKTKKQSAIDRRRGRDPLLMDKIKTKKQLLELKNEKQEEAQNVNTAEEMEEISDPLSKAIKQEQIDLDYTDLSESADQNITT